MGIHRVYLDGADFETGSTIHVVGDEAHHAARSKRLREGDHVEILNGRGVVARGEIAELIKSGRGEWALSCRVLERREVEPVCPGLHVFAPAPKGPRLLEMIDQLSQTGAASWSPLVTTRTVVNPRGGKLQKAERAATEASKQSGRAWTMEIGPQTTLPNALRRTGTRTIAAHASGVPFVRDESESVSLLIGPEGGFSEEELEAARDAGAEVCRFGRHVMRLETAAVVATGIILDGAER